MCGIFGYIGRRTDAAAIILEGLKRLDYRGYDSWGIAVCDDANTLFIEKQAGKISDLQDVSLFPKSSIAIGHTRWATNGGVTRANAHPHFSTDKSFALAQNGIVENCEELKEELSKKGYTFISETDTEVIVRLIEDELKKTYTLQQAIFSAFKKLTGRNTIILITKDKEIFAARNGSPLVIGFNTDEVFLSSDTLSFAPFAKKMLVVDNGQLVKITNNVQLFDISTEKELTYEMTPISITTGKIDKEGYDHFMMKEIFEAPFVLEQLVKQDAKQYEDFAKALKKAKNIYTIGSGGAGVAAAQVAFYLRSIGRMKATSLIGADALEYGDLFTKEDIIIAVSQSGETADVLEIIEPAKKKGVKIASFVNMPGSMITRISDYPFMSESGPEICVMSTKTFDAQVAWGYLIAKTVQGDLAGGKEQLITLAKEIKMYLDTKENHTKIRKIAKYLSKKESVFLLGKQQNFQIMREGMVKIVEASYIHGHALPSGDLKHYIITLMEKGVSVIVGITNDNVKADLLTAVHEVRLRGAEVIAIATQHNAAFDYYMEIPDTKETVAIMTLIPLQLLGYYMAKELGNSIDKPRNIAKSVTVK
jgi:glucosamine--fructose-6-phosphate aminotransferase (isomerizing)